MTEPLVITANDWLEKALQEGIASHALADAGLWSQAFYHAGFAVECALKYLVMRRGGLNAWPDRNDARHLYTHDLVVLAQEAGLALALAMELDRRSEIGICWLIAKDWKNETRYDPLPMPEPRARDMVAAIGDRGLLTWLINF